MSADADRGKLAVALGLLLVFMAFEVVVGISIGSLALLSDAAHMLTDAGAIALSLVAINLAARPARGQMTFGLKRTEILSAQFNGATLLVLGLLIAVEGVRRLFSPPEVEGGWVLVVALIGVAVNLAATWTLSKANRQSMNVEGAFQHILTDLAAFVCTAIAGAVILLTGFARADGIASLIIAAIMIHASWGLLIASGRVFLEAAPGGLDVGDIGRALAAGPGVVEVHELDVWEVSSSFPSLSAHVLVGEQADCHAARRDLERMSSATSTSSTPPCRSTTRAASCWTSSPPSSTSAPSPRPVRTETARRLVIALALLSDGLLVVTATRAAHVLGASTVATLVCGARSPARRLGALDARAPPRRRPAPVRLTGPKYP